MFKSIVKGRIRAFAARYRYDASYMEALFDASPAAFFKFLKLSSAAQHREAAPIDAYYAAKIAGARFEDCGPCIQLVVNMAEEAGMPKHQIEAVLLRRYDEMNPDTALGFRFAEAVIARAGALDEVQDAIRYAWGEKGLIDLTFSLQFGRMFPMVKLGLGRAAACSRVMVGDAAFDLTPIAA